MSDTTEQPATAGEGHRVAVYLPPDVADQVDAIRAEAIVGGARPTQSATVLALVCRGLAALAADHKKPPASAG